MRNALRSILKPADLALRILLPLLAGYLLALVLIPTPQIAIVRVEGDIWGSYTADISQALEQAGNDRAVRAVVLDVSSPGGEVSASEGLYFDLLKLREIKPVVVSVDEMAASGAYYIAAAADRIYAKPASMVGNIGVISILGEADLVDEVLITTGPFKLSGGPQDAYIRQMELLKQTFLAAIMAQRQDRLKVGPDVLSRGEIYLGLQAQQMGLIDAVGSQAEAVAEAARLARVRRYRVVDCTPELAFESFLFIDEPEGRSTAATVADLPQALPPGCYYRYVELLP
ncbi:MAG: S49 family peptidase [Anaerolineae bacterium]|nr:S49 family peptidase [Anaerolineae bacterium]